MNAEFLAEFVTFLVMLALIVVYGWPRIRKVAQAEQDKITAQLAEAEKSKLEIAASLAESQKQLDEAKGRAEEIIVRARKAAEEEGAEIRARGQAESAAFLVAAKSQMDSERDRAINELRREFGDLVVDAAGKALSSALTEKGHAHLVEETVAKIGTSPAERN